MIRLLVLAAAVMAIGAFATARADDRNAAATGVDNSHMAVGGVIGIGRNFADPPAFAQGNQVAVIDPSSGLSLASGQVEDGSGTYSVTISAPPSMSGTRLTMRVKIGCLTYQLVQSTGLSAVNVNFAFNGTPTFPTILTLNPSLGPAVENGCGDVAAARSPTAASAPDSIPCPPSLPGCDVAGVGTFDQRAIAAMKECLASLHPGKNCDANRDGVVDTRDLIDLLRAYAEVQRQAAAKRTSAAVSAPLSGSSSP